MADNTKRVKRSGEQRMETPVHGLSLHIETIEAFPQGERVLSVGCGGWVIKRGYKVYWKTVGLPSFQQLDHFPLQSDSISITSDVANGSVFIAARLSSNAIGESTKLCM